MPRLFFWSSTPPRFADSDIRNTGNAGIALRGTVSFAPSSLARRFRYVGIAESAPILCAFNALLYTELPTCRAAFTGRPPPQLELYSL